jgi:aspartate/methionine/tyrosine aminotransferase
LYGNVQPFASDWLATRAFEHLSHLRSRSQDILDRNRAAFLSWVEGRADVTMVTVKWGTTVCLKPTRTDVNALCAELRARYDVSVVPGRFFELPDYIRIGLSVEPATFREGIDRIGACLTRGHAGAAAETLRE